MPWWEKVRLWPLKKWPQWLEASLAGRFPIVSIEDGMSEDDFVGWAALNAAFGQKMPIGWR
jgi:enolase